MFYIQICYIRMCYILALVVLGLIFLDGGSKKYETTRQYHTLAQRTQQARRSRYATGLQRHDSCYKQQALVRLPA